MATRTAVQPARARVIGQVTIRPYAYSQARCHCHRQSRLFSSSTRLHRQQTDYKETFGTRLRKALHDTKIKWYPIPVGVGIGFLGFGQLYRVNERERARRREEIEDDGSIKITGINGPDGEGGLGKQPKRRERIKPTGPWFVLAFIVRENC